MVKGTLLPVVAATISAGLVWALVSHLIWGQVNWLSTIIFVVTFALVLGILWERRSTRREE
jgi:hypothetical protein